MTRTFLESSNIISSLGWNTRENLHALLSGSGGIGISNDGHLSDTPVQASLIDRNELERRFGNMVSSDPYTRFEKAGILSIHDALLHSRIDPADPGTILVLSTTKGNVELLEDPKGFESDRLYLWKSAQVIARFFGMKNRAVVVSNACISGVVAMLEAHRLVANGKFNHAIVTGIDVLSRFIVSGFQSFMSLSAQPCRPFDEKRDGLSLGEVAATVIISGQHGDAELIKGAISNDANHISGPSRTGDGLLLSIMNTVGEKDEVDLISAHGTATVYNDEMESKAISGAGLGMVPVNSLKGYFGHTLGGAGILESILNIEAMKQGVLIPTMGYRVNGVSGKINVIGEIERKNTQSLLKIASGFGGCNVAALFRLS